MTKYGLIAAIFALVGAFFYGVNLTKKMERVAQENERLIELAKKKEQTITALESWINGKEKSQKKETKINRAANVTELHSLYQEITGYGEAPNNDPK